MTVAAGTTVYACFASADIFDTTAGPATNVVAVDDHASLPQTPNVTIPKGGQYTWTSAPFVATTTQTHAFTVRGTGAAGVTYTGGPDSGTLTVVHPGLTVQKTVSTTGTCPGSELVNVLSGTQVKYCYAVTNTGDTTVNGVTVTDAVGAPLTVGTMARGETRTVSSVSTPTASTSSTAVAAGTDGTTGTAVASAPDGASVNVSAPSISVATTVSSNGTCPGAEIVNVLTSTPLTWCYVVTNTGNAAVSGVTVSDDVFGAVPGAAATLTAGQSVTFRRSDTSSVDTTLSASASGTAVLTGGPVHSNVDPAAVNVVGPRIDVDVTVSSNGVCPGTDTASVAAGVGVLYCYKVSNIGDDALSNIDVVNQDNADIGTIASLLPGQSTMIVGTSAPLAGDAQETATATGTDPYGFGVMATDLAKVHALLPGVSIQKTVSADGTCPGSERVAVVSGAPVTSCYAVTNTGATPLTGLVVTDNGATVNVGNLLPGASSTVSSTAAATAGASTTATASGTNGPTGLGITSAPDGASVDVVSPSLTVAKTASADGSCPGTELVTVLAGAQVTYCYVVTNSGDTLVSNVVITDGGVTLNVGDLAPGQTGRSGQSVTAASDTETPAVASGAVPVTGTAVSSPPDSAAFAVVHPSLSVQKTASVGGSCPGSEQVTVLSGASVTYCYAVTNTGDTSVSRVVVVDGDVSVVIGDLGPGQTGTGSSAVSVTAGASTTAVASGTTTATLTPVDSAPDGATVVVVNPALSVQKTVSSDGTCPGSESVSVLSGGGVTYCYTVTNTGDTTVSGVVVDDNGQRVTIGDLAAGQSGNGTASGTASASGNSGAVASGTTVATSTPVSSAPDGASVVVVNPALSIEKTVSTTGTCPGAESVTVLSGSSVTYCYAVTNTGDTAVRGVIVGDAGASASVGDLEPGQTGKGSAVVTVSASVDTSAAASGTVVATHTPVSSGGDGASVVVVNPALSIAKTASTDGTCPGSELVTVLANTHVTYCYAVTNSGDTAIRGVVVNDGAAVVSIGDLAAGASGSGTSGVQALADTNTGAAATGTTTATGTSVASPPDGAGIDVVSPALTIAATVSTNGACPGQEVVNVLAGSAVTWCYAVTNTGDVQATAVTVTDNQYGIVPGAPFTLDPGQSSTVSLQVSAPADVTLTASAAGVVPATGTRVLSPQDPAVVNVVSPNVDIDVTVSTTGSCPGVDSTAVPAGTTVTYCYKITNNGDDVLSDVNVVDGAQTAISELFDLAAGASTVIASLPTVVNGDVTLAATATGTDAYGFPVRDSDTALVHALFAKLQIQKTVSLDGTCPGTELATVLPGTAVTYCYFVTNSGGTAVTGVTVDDGGAIVQVGDLVPGQSILVSDAVTAAVDENIGAFAVGTNPATSQPVRSASDDAAVHVVHPALAVAKTVSLDGTCPGSEVVTVLQGAAVTYCYEVTNTGDTTVGDISVGDTGVNVLVGSLVAGQATIVSTTITAGTLDLTTSATATGTDNATWTPVRSGKDSAMVDVIHPALSLATTVSTSGACPGSEIVEVLPGAALTYCYTLTNTGDVALNAGAAGDNQFGTVPGGGGSIGVGQTLVLRRSVSATVDMTVNATASAVDARIGSAVISNQDPAVVDVVHPAIALDVTVASNGVCPGVDALTVTAGASVVSCYKVTNLGDDTLTNVVVTDAAGHVLSTTATLAAGASKVITGATTQALADFNVPGTVTAIDQYGFPVTKADTAKVHTLLANLALLKTAPSQIDLNKTSGGDDDNDDNDDDNYGGHGGGGSCGGGGGGSGSGSGGSSSAGSLVYTLVVSNVGQALAVKPVVRDTLPAGTTYVSATTTSGTCSYASGTVTCKLADVAAGATATIKVTTSVTAKTGTITNTATVTTTTPESDLSDNTSSAATKLVNGSPTRSCGYYANHPKLTQDCLATLGGSLNLGWMTLRDENFDNEIDGHLHGADKDHRKETGISMVMGVLNASCDHYTNNAKRSSLEQVKMAAAKELVAAVCNVKHLGTTCSFDLDGMIGAMSGTNAALIQSYTNQANAFNGCGDRMSLPHDPGSANGCYPWDDPSDSND
jgi:uncharacterized repeat protein (TIGR01451 family)